MVYIHFSINTQYTYMKSENKNKKQHTYRVKYDYMWYKAFTDD